MIQQTPLPVLEKLLHDWSFWERPSQCEPEGDWQYWVVKAGRGFGKTRIGAEWIRRHARHLSFCNLIGATADDARDIMVDGESGILAICPPDERPIYRKSERKLIWPNGSVSLIFTADEPERLRGKQHRKLWADELGAWRYEEAWTQATLGLRLGPNPQGLVTTTPRPTALLRRLLADPNTVVTEGSTYDNRENLAPAFFGKIIRLYEGTRLGRQELLAELLDDNPFALWKRAWVEQTRVQQAPEMRRIVIGVDPAVSGDETSDETGIVVAGMMGGADSPHYFVLADRSLRGSPRDWARTAVSAYEEFGADRIIAEVNNGGEMVEATIRAVDLNVAYTAVRASRGKVIRAEPISALYEKGLVHHVGAFPVLEDQLCEWVPGDPSPDRLDALVWAMTELQVAPFALPVAGSGIGKGLKDSPLPGGMR